MLKVITINKKDYTSEKTGKVYTSYDLACLNEEKGRAVNVQVDGKAIDQLVAQSKIRTADDLIGKTIQLARLEPIYLTEFEKQYNSIKYDYIIGIK